MQSKRKWLKTSCVLGGALTVAGPLIGRLTTVYQRRGAFQTLIASGSGDPIVAAAEVFTPIALGLCVLLTGLVLLLTCLRRERVLRGFELPPLLPPAR